MDQRIGCLSTCSGAQTSRVADDCSVSSRTVLLNGTICPSQSGHCIAGDSQVEAVPNSRYFQFFHGDLFNKVSVIVILVSIRFLQLKQAFQSLFWPLYEFQNFCQLDLYDMVGLTICKICNYNSYVHFILFQLQLLCTFYFILFCQLTHMYILFYFVSSISMIWLDQQSVISAFTTPMYILLFHFFNTMLCLKTK